MRELIKKACEETVKSGGLDKFDWGPFISQLSSVSLTEMLDALERIRKESEELEKERELELKEDSEISPHLPIASSDTHSSTASMSQKLDTPISRIKILKKEEVICKLFILYGISGTSELRSCRERLLKKEVFEDLCAYYQEFCPHLNISAKEVEKRLAILKLSKLSDYEIEIALAQGDYYSWESSDNGYRVTAEKKGAYIQINDDEADRKEIDNPDVGVYQKDGISRGAKFHISIDTTDVKNYKKGRDIVRDILLLDYNVFGFKYSRVALLKKLQKGKAITVYAFLSPEKPWAEILEKLEKRLQENQVAYMELPKDNYVAVLNSNSSQYISFRNDYFRKEEFDDADFFKRTIKKILELSYQNDQEREEMVYNIFSNFSQYKNNITAELKGFIEVIAEILKHDSDSSSDSFASSESSSSEDSNEDSSENSSEEKSSEGESSSYEMVRKVKKADPWMEYDVSLSHAINILDRFLLIRDDFSCIQIWEVEKKEIFKLLNLLKVKIGLIRGDNAEGKVENKLKQMMRKGEKVQNFLEIKEQYLKNTVLKIIQNKEGNFETAFRKYEVFLNYIIESTYQYYNSYAPYYYSAMMSQALLDVLREDKKTTNISSVSNPFGFDNPFERCESDDDEEEKEGEEDNSPSNT